MIKDNFVVFKTKILKSGKKKNRYGRIYKNFFRDVKIIILKILKLLFTFESNLKTLRNNEYLKRSCNIAKCENVRKSSKITSFFISIIIYFYL